MHDRKLLAWAVLILLLGGGFLMWRSLSRSQTDEQQILTKLESVSQAARTMNSQGIVSPMTEEFRWQGQNKREINSQLTGFFFSAHKVDVKLSDMDVKVKGERASVDGAFHITYQMAPDARPKLRLGRFRTIWIKHEGDWKMSSAEGGENLEP
ncbi:MAG: hypothetical protein JWN98_2122 [Abditibacteriota bacterium]|jgi:ketosteroid isomerase-like protein|nr:hypothetical protein [Abditibacteriota bacterium]